VTSVIGDRSNSSQFVAEYVWGLLGPIARIDLQNPANTRYYVIDGLGHVRALVAPNGAITEVWHYDSWGNILSMPAQRIEQPFLWNGAYGYEYIPLTGLYHVGAREYDPRTTRWLQRDPIDVAGGHPNVYLYSFNSPLIWKDPSGLQIVIFVHGSFSNPSTFDKSFISAVKQTLGAEGHVMFQWSGTADYNQMLKDAQSFCSFVQQVKAKHPLEPIYVVAHSNGGNVATAASALGASIDLIIRLGSPLPDPNKFGEYWDPFGTAIVFNFYDPDDAIIRGAIAKKACWDPGANPLWQNIQVEAGNGILQPLATHSDMRSKQLWETQVAPYVGWVKYLDWREWLR